MHLYWLIFKCSYNVKGKPMPLIPPHGDWLMSTLSKPPSLQHRLRWPKVKLIPVIRRLWNAYLSSTRVFAGHCSEFHSITESLLQFQPSHLVKMRLCKLHHTTFGSSNVNFLAVQKALVHWLISEHREEDRESGLTGREREAFTLHFKETTDCSRWIPRQPQTASLHYVFPISITWMT